MRQRPSMRRALCRPLRPAEPFGADAIAFKQAVAAPRPPRFLIVISKIAHAEFDRIDPQPFGRFIEGGFERKRSRRRARRAHRDGVRLIGADETVRRRDIGAGIQKARIDRGGVRIIGVGRGLREHVMFNAGKATLRAEAERQVLHCLLAPTDQGEHLRARQFQAHRTAGFPGCQHRPEHPRPPELPLAAEAAAEETRDDADVRCRHPESMRDHGAGAEDGLGRSVHDGLAVLPPADHGVRFHRVMIVDGGLVSISDDEIGIHQCLGCVTTTGRGRKASDHGWCK